MNDILKRRQYRIIFYLKSYFFVLLVTSQSLDKLFYDLQINLKFTFSF